VVDVLRETLGNLDGKIADKGLAVSVLLDGSPDRGQEGAVIPANPLLLESMIANLLLNAVEAAPKGGEIAVTLDAGESLVLAITNTGAVPQGLRETFFDKYSTQGKLGGTGLGTYSDPAGGQGHGRRHRAVGLRRGGPDHPVRDPARRVNPFSLTSGLAGRTQGHLFQEACYP